MYGDKSQNAYLEKSALETAIIHGGTNCDTLPDDDPNFKACDPDAVPNSAVNFMKVRSILILLLLFFIFYNFIRCVQCSFFKSTTW